MLVSSVWVSLKRQSFLSSIFLPFAGPPKFSYARKEKQDIDLDTFEKEEEMARAEVAAAAADAADSDNDDPKVLLTPSKDALLEADINPASQGNGLLQELQDEFAADVDQQSHPVIVATKSTPRMVINMSFSVHFFHY